MSIKSDLTVRKNRACNIQTYKFALQTQLSEKRVFSKGHFTKGQFFQKRTSPRVDCVQTRSRQGGSLSFRRKRKSRSSDGTVFRKRTSPRESCVQMRSCQGGSLSFRENGREVLTELFFQKRTSPRVSCVQIRSHQGGSLSFRRKRKRGSDGTVFFENGLRQGELRSNAIMPRDKSVKTDHRQGGSAPSRRIKCNTGIRFRNRIDRTSSRTEEAFFCFPVMHPTRNTDTAPTISCRAVFLFGVGK